VHGAKLVTVWSLHGHAIICNSSCTFEINSLDHTVSLLTSLGMAVARPDHTTRGSYAGITVAAGAMDESEAAALSKATASTEKVAMAAVACAQRSEDRLWCMSIGLS
jgi:hypothetical protein